MNTWTPPSWRTQPRYARKLAYSVRCGYSAFARWHFLLCRGRYHPPLLFVHEHLDTWALEHLNSWTPLSKRTQPRFTRRRAGGRSHDSLVNSLTSYKTMSFRSLAGLLCWGCSYYKHMNTWIYFYSNMKPCKIRHTLQPVVLGQGKMICSVCERYLLKNNAI